MRMSEQSISFAMMTRAPLSTFGHVLGNCITDVDLMVFPPATWYSVPLPSGSSLHLERNLRDDSLSVQFPAASCTDSAASSTKRKCGYCFTFAIITTYWNGCEFSDVWQAHYLRQVRDTRHCNTSSRHPCSMKRNIHPPTRFASCL